MSIMTTFLTHTIVAAPASHSVGCVSHLLQGLSTKIAQLPQTAVMEHPRADPAGVEVVRRPHLTDITHLVARRLVEKAESVTQEFAE